MAPNPTSAAGGGGRIRTYEGISQQIYSLPPLAAWVPLLKMSRVFCGGRHVVSIIAVQFPCASRPSSCASRIYPCASRNNYRGRCDPDRENLGSEKTGIDIIVR